MFLGRLLVLLAALLFAASSVSAQPPRPPLIRSSFDLPVDIDGTTVRLEAMEIRPRGPGPFPLVVIAHGKTSGDAGRRAQTALGMTTRAVAFARRGFLAVVAMRRGYGSSQGPYSESDGDCRATRYVEASRASARELAAIVVAAGSRPGADRSRVLLAGESVGGATALTVATMPPPGLLGVINFAGGRGGNPKAPGEVCQPDRLIEAFRSFGAAGRLPTLWIYAENDKTFRPQLVRAMYEAYTAAGGRASLLMLPPIGEDGHEVFAHGAAAWRTPVDDFLRQLGLPVSPPAPALTSPLPLGPNGRAAFEEFLGSSYPFRAFATSGRGPFGWAFSARSREEARRVALAHCQRSGTECEVVAEIVEIEDLTAPR